jgi:hypothetical protein
VQLVNQQEQNIQLSNRTESRGHTTKPAVEFRRDVVVELEDRQELAEAPRRDTRAMQRGDIAVLHALQDARETIESRLEQFRPPNHGHDRVNADGVGAERRPHYS